jgi:four helix bundle protein
MIKIQNLKIYDLEERTLKFSKDVRVFIKWLPKTISNIEDGRQVVRSSGSMGANYIEANEALSKKDFIHRIKICRKESKETRYWLKLIEANNDTIPDQKCQQLIVESHELMMIFGSIVRKSE